MFHFQKAGETRKSIITAILTEEERGWVLIQYPMLQTLNSPIYSLQIHQNTLITIELQRIPLTADFEFYNLTSNKLK